MARSKLCYSFSSESVDLVRESHFPCSSFFSCQSCQYCCLTFVSSHFPCSPISSGQSWQDGCLTWSSCHLYSCFSTAGWIGWLSNCISTFATKSQLSKTAQGSKKCGGVSSCLLWQLVMTSSNSFSTQISHADHAWAL